MNRKKQPMKTYAKSKLLLPNVSAGLALMLAGRLTAQTFTTLHYFNTTVDGDDPEAGLVLSGNTLYGALYSGGVFKLNTDGSGFSDVYGLSGDSGEGPDSTLVLSGDTLYGTAYYGGTLDSGTVFKVNTDGTGFATLHDFTAAPGPLYTNSDGTYPGSALALSGSTLYGTTYPGGSGGNGTIFSVNTDGSDFTALHSFGAYASTNDGTNSDGANPHGGVIVSGDTLFGTAFFGGALGWGTVFALNTDGTGFTTLHNFTAPVGSPLTNGDGAYPRARLMLSGNTLYGTTWQGGSSGAGAVFAVNTDGTGFATLHSFAAALGPGATNSDGAYPRAGLVLAGNTLYGTAAYGGSTGSGTVFALNTDGSGFTILHTFSSNDYYTNSDGAYPWAGLVLAGDTLYGTTVQGGPSGSGTVFRISLAPQLIITSAGPNVILTWPTNLAGFSYAGYTLQSTANLGPSAAWTSVSPAPVLVNGQYTVTNPVSGNQQFYRLGQ
jgi:uncharacterized repeat protein (TIGR03803 family)